MLARRRNPPKKKDSILARYFFHIFALVLVILTIAYIYLYANGQISTTDANTDLSITLSMMFSIVVFSYLILRGMTINEVLRTLGLSKENMSTKAVANAAILFLIIFALEVAVSLISQATGIQLPTNVGMVLGGEPFYFLMFAVFLSPINEEIFFRGFLIPRLATLFGEFLPRWSSVALGIFFSALIFAVLHAGYMSISEFAAAFVFGIAAGYVFMRYKSLYATILAHFAVNLLAVLALLAVGAIII